MAMTPESTPSGNGTERRRHTRYNMALDVAFGLAGVNQRTRPSELQLQRTVTVNLSLGGLCMYTDTLYPMGTQLFCSVTLPKHEKPLELVGVVAWFHKVEQDAHGYKLGIEFGDLPEDDQRILNTLLESPPDIQTDSSRRLLLVEDDVEMRQAMKLRFESSGFQVSTAGDGLEALRKAREERPDAIVLDVMLPRLNGYEVCRLLKFDPKFQHIPIIFCTARSRQQDVALSKSVGADAYITKPFDGKALLDKVNSVLDAVAK